MQTAPYKCNILSTRRNLCIVISVVETSIIPVIAEGGGGG
jgi:hypothetical protein